MEKYAKKILSIRFKLLWCVKVTDKNLNKWKGKNTRLHGKPHSTYTNSKKDKNYRYYIIYRHTNSGVTTVYLRINSHQWRAVRTSEVSAAYPLKKEENSVFLIQNVDNSNIKKYVKL